MYLRHVLSVGPLLSDQAFPIRPEREVTTLGILCCEQDNCLSLLLNLKGFDESASRYGNVNLQIDLMQGSYMVFDKILFTANNTSEEGSNTIPLTAGLSLLLARLRDWRQCGNNVDFHCSAFSMQG